MMGGKNENQRGNPAIGGDRGQAAQRHGADHLSAVQRGAEEQDRPLPVRDVQAGWDRLALLAL